jgi:DNA-binding IclR family transcriptional regulator
MANSAISSLGLRQHTAPYLSGLRMRTGLTVHLAILEQNEAVLIGKQETSRGARLATWVGKRMDFHCTAVGKAILAFLPEAGVDAVFHKHGLARHNENTIATTRRMHEELERVVKVGYALDNEETELGVRCLGIPIFGPQARPLAAISIAGATSEISLDDLPHLSSELRQTATAISRDVVESMTQVTFPRGIASVAS